MVERENTNFTMVDEFYQETQVRLLADKIRMHGIRARIADDQFREYLGLNEKQNYIHGRIQNAQHVLFNMQQNQGVEYTQDVIDSSRDYILNGDHFENEKKGLVANFYHESKFKSVNDELIEALQEFEIAINGNTRNQQIAKTEMAKILFNLPDQKHAVLNAMAERFVRQGISRDLRNQLAVRSASGEAKWNQAGPLVIRAGRVTPYCSVRLTNQDYQYSTDDCMKQIADFVQKDLQKFVQNKKRRFVAGQMIVKAVQSLFQRIS